MASTASVKVSVFLSTPSARRATRSSVSRSFRRTFLSTPSARRATFPAPRLCHKVDISIHALREEGDALRAGRPAEQATFLSTPSARRATSAARRTKRILNISIHALREEGDFRECVILVVHKISIHALREEGDCCYPRETGHKSGFLSTPSARRATFFW